jgi:hypothetical protein
MVEVISVVTPLTMIVYITISSPGTLVDAALFSLVLVALYSPLPPRPVENADAPPVAMTDVNADVIWAGVGGAVDEAKPSVPEAAAEAPVVDTSLPPVTV